MKKWMIIAYILVSLVVTAVILMGAWLTFFANPLNWKDYKDCRTVDYIAMWGSNGLIVIVGIALVVMTWCGFWKLMKCVANHTSESTS